MSKQISSNRFKKEIIYKIFEMGDVKLLLWHSNNWDYLTVCKQIIDS